MITDKEVIRTMIQGGLTQCPVGAVDPAVWEEVKNEAPAQAQAVVVAPTQAQVPAQAQGYMPANGEAFTMDEMARGSSNMAVDVVLKTKSGKVLLGSDFAQSKPFKVKLKFADCVAKLSVKCQNRENKIEYFNTYDGRTENYSGRSWMDCVAYAHNMSGASPYKSADLIFIADEDIMSEDGKRALAKKGSTIGHSLGMMNFKNEWAPFYRENKDEQGEMLVEIGTKSAQNKNNQVWTDFTFTRVG